MKKLLLIAVMVAIAISVTGCAAGKTATVSNLTITYPGTWKVTHEDLKGSVVFGVIVPSTIMVKPTDGTGSALILSDASESKMGIKELSNLFLKSGNAKASDVDTGGKQSIRIEGIDEDGNYTIVLITEEEEKAAGMAILSMTKEEYDNNYATYDSIISGARV